MIGDSVDFFQSQISSKIYLNSLLVSIWDIMYKAGRLYEESINRVVVDQTSPNPLLERPESLVDMLRVNLKQVKSLMPDPLLLDYMKRQEKLVSGVLLPMRTELEAASSQNQQDWMHLVREINNYPDDVALIHTVCDVVQNMERDRLQRNLSKIQNDLAQTIGQANSREESMLNTKQSYENSIIELRKIVKKSALVLKECQLDSTAKDLDMLTQSDGMLGEILAKMVYGVRDLTTHLEDKLQEVQDNTHREAIQAEYTRRQTKKHCTLDTNWKPFLPEIQLLERTKDTTIIGKLVQSFEVLFASIEWTFQEEFVPDPSLQIVENMSRMQEFVVAKAQELEYCKIRADDAAHSVTQEFVAFWEKLFEQIVATVGEVFFEHPNYRIIVEQLKMRDQFASELRQSFGLVKAKFADHEREYGVPEYWKELSSICFDFTERVYTKYNPQKIKLLQAVLGILIDFRVKLEHMVKEIQVFHSREFEQVKSTTTKYRSQLVEWYNTLIMSLKQQHSSLKLKDCYQVRFVKNNLEVQFAPELLTQEGYQMNRTLYSLPLNIPAPPVLGNKVWELNYSAVVTEESKKNLMKQVDQKYSYFTKNPKIVWEKLRSVDLPDLTMAEYLNLVIRDRTLKVEGKFYKSFNALMQSCLSETIISFENYEPAIEVDILCKSLGMAEAKNTKEKPMKIPIPFFPPTYQSDNEITFVMLGTRQVCSFQKSVSRGIPGSDAFYVLSGVEVKSKQTAGKPSPDEKGLAIDMYYAVVFHSSTMLEGTIRENVPKEVSSAYKKFEECISKVLRENEVNVLAVDPAERKETNNVYARKMENSGILQSLPDRTSEIFAPPISAKEREALALQAKRRRYLGEYDKRAIYHSGPEALNPEFEDIFVAGPGTQTTKDKILSYLRVLQERNLGAVDEIAAKQQEFVSLLKTDPRSLLEESKSLLFADWRRVGILAVVVFALVLKVLGY